MASREQRIRALAARLPEPARRHEPRQHQRYFFENLTLAEEMRFDGYRRRLIGGATPDAFSAAEIEDLADLRQKIETDPKGAHHGTN